jgi:hypothetical protein
MEGFMQPAQLDVNSLQFLDSSRLDFLGQFKFKEEFFSLWAHS